MLMQLKSLAFQTFIEKAFYQKYYINETGKIILTFNPPREEDLSNQILPL